jgi:hypothetical protein
MRTVARFIRDFAHAFIQEARNLFSSKPQLSVLEHTEHHLVLRCGSRKLLADGRTKTIHVGPKLVASFAGIREVEITERANNDGPVTWALTLKLFRHPPLFLAKSQDSTETSIAAAHLSTITGKPVTTSARRL